MSIKGVLTKIDPGRKCLSFLEKRIDNNNYRGMQISQHNRYDRDIIFTLLNEMHKKVGYNKMAIRTTDLSKRPKNTYEEKIYAEYVATISNKLGRCTQDSVRKNLFVDLNRMGFINRFDKNMDLVLTNERKAIKYVQLTHEAKRFIEAKRIFDKDFIYTKGIERLTHGLETNLFSVIQELDNKLFIEEFMYFGSFLGCELHNKIYTGSDIIELIKDYRHMSKYQRIQLDKEVIEYCNPNNFNKKGMNKNDKRDYHNWKNEAEQIYMLLNQTVLYEIIDKNKLVVKVGEGALFENEAKLKRSYSEKKKYFENHDIQKTPGFELHHIVSLFMANNKNEYSSLDVWQNMIYIDAYMHSKLHDTCDTYFEIEFENNNLIIEDIEFSNKNKNLKLIKDKNILYNTKNIKTMKSYNKGYLESLLDITNE